MNTHNEPTGRGAGRRPSRLRSGGVLSVLLGVLLGVACALQPSPAAMAATPTGSASSPSTATALSAVVHAGVGGRVGTQVEGLPAAGRLVSGCLGPDVVCDVGGAAVEAGRERLGGVAGDVARLRAGIPSVPGVPRLGGCGLLDALCGKAGHLLSGAGAGRPGMRDLGKGIAGLVDIANPFDELGDVVAKAAADAWTAAMLALWAAGLFILRIALTFSELFLTPDLRQGGPGKAVYGYALWGALALVVVMTIVQLGVAAFRREGKGLARALIGTGQFVVVCAVWFGYGVTIVAACGAITRALMKALLGVNTWPEWDPLGGLGVQDVADGTVATVLGLLGLLLWLAALGHLLVYLARAAALLVLIATGPLAAAGLASDAGRAWFWKSLRWFHAAAFTPVLMVLVLGVGVQMATGVAAHLADSTQKAIGTALPAVMLICVSAVAPVALFKLLAFVDPGTPSGASFRQGLALQGGIQGLLTGGAGGGGGSSAASRTDGTGRSAGEQDAEASTGDRFGRSTQGLAGGLGTAGQALATGLGWVQSAGAKGVSLISDETNQTGVGHHTYGPDFSNARGNTGRGGGDGITGGGHPGQHDHDDHGDHGDHGDGDADTPPPPAAPPIPPMPFTPPAPPTGAPTGRGGAGPGDRDDDTAAAAPKPAGVGAGGGAAGGGAGAGAGAGAAGAIPPVV